jgi:hypothetical protein
MRCWKCAATIEFNERVGFRDACAGCDRPAHCCRNCGFYDVTYNNECRETMAERVVEKERANFCEYFQPRIGAAAAAAGRPSSGDARARLDKMFRKKS